MLSNKLSSYPFSISSPMAGTFVYIPGAACTQGGSQGGQRHWGSLLKSLTATSDPRGADKELKEVSELKKTIQEQNGNMNRGKELLKQIQKKFWS